MPFTLDADQRAAMRVDASIQTLPMAAAARNEMDGIMMVLTGVGATIGTIAARGALERSRNAEQGDHVFDSATHRLGITRADAASAGLEHQLTRARQYCRLCPLTDDCTARLSSSRSADLPEYCVNLPLFARIEQARVKRT
jgi:hypothetical protein